MKLEKEELLRKLSDYIGDDSSDEAISLIEDVSDSFENNDDSWKIKFEENDKMWREKYRDRFFNGDADVNIEDNRNDEPEETVIKTYEELFKYE